MNGVCQASRLYMGPFGAALLKAPGVAPCKVSPTALETGALASLSSQIEDPKSDLHFIPALVKMEVFVTKLFERL